MQSTKNEHLRETRVLKIFNCYNIILLFLGICCNISGKSSSIKKEIHFKSGFLRFGEKLFTIYYPSMSLSRRTTEPRAPSCVLPWNLKECFHRMRVEEGRVSVPQLDSCDPQGPDVTAGVIGGLELLLTSNDLPDRNRTQHINRAAPSDCPEGSWPF